MIELKDGKVETMLSEDDFVYLVETYMGHEAAEYVNDLIETLDWYREGWCDDD